MVSLQTYFDQEWQRAWQEAQNGRGGILVFYGQEHAPELQTDALKKACRDFGSARLDPRSLHEPYGPVFEWIKQWWQKQSNNERSSFFKNQPKYPYVTQTLLRLIQSRTISKIEPLLTFSTEIQTAQQQMDQLIVDLWLHRCQNDHPCLYFLEDFQWASPSLVRLILDLASRKTQNLPFLLVILMERNQSMFIQKDWNHFYSLTENKSIFLSQTLHENSAQFPQSPPEINPERLLRQSHEAFQLLAFEEARETLKLLMNNFGLGAHREEELELTLLLAKTYDSLQDYQNAIITLSQAVNLAMQLGDTPALAQAYLIQAIVYLKKENFSNCHQFLEKVKRLELPENDYVSLYAEMIHTLLNMVQSVEIHFRDVDSTIAKLQQKNWRNAVYFIKTQVPYLLSIRKELGEEAFQHQIKGLARFSHSINHNFRLSILEHVLGMVKQLDGQTPQALRHYQKAIRLRTTFGNILELTKIYNGTGFVCLQAKLFARAVRYFSKALNLLEQVDDYQEIILTLLNLGITYLMGLQLKDAQRALESVLRLVAELNVQFVPFHPMHEIYSLAGWSFFWGGDQAKAFNYLRLALHSHDYQSQPLVRSLQHVLETAPNSVNWELVKAEWQKIDQMPIDFWIQNIDKIGNIGKAFQNPNRLSPFRFRIEGVLNSARQFINLTRLNKKFHEIQFLNQLQAVIGRTAHWQEMIRDAMRLIKNSFVIDHIYLIMLNELKQKELVYVYPEDFEENIDFWSLNLLFEDKRPALLIPSELLPQRWNGGAMFSLFHQGQVYGWLICGTSLNSSKLETEILKTIQIAVSQISMAVELKRVNERLVKSSTIDPVTGLMNRQEIYRQMSNELRRVKRYKSRNYGPFCLIFIDLDNFKYYNENFGSDLGDHLLKLFADLLRDVLRDVDMVGRFGSDEFLILLPETNIQGAQVVANRINEQLKKCDYFIKEINIYLKRRAVIPNQKFLTCSMGIAEYNNTTGLDMEELIAVTDNALFEAKHTVKNVTIILPPNSGQ